MSWFKRALSCFHRSVSGDVEENRTKNPGLFTANEWIGRCGLEGCWRQVEMEALRWSSQKKKNKMNAAIFTGIITQCCIHEIFTRLTVRSYKVRG